MTSRYRFRAAGPPGRRVVNGGDAREEDVCLLVVREGLGLGRRDARVGIQVVDDRRVASTSVCDFSPWFALHLAMGISSYCLFAMAVVHAWLLNRTEQQIRRALDPHSGIPLLTLERLTFRLIGIGFVLLSVTLLAGWLFGETLYGPGYASKSSWDHKTVFSVLSWVTFAALLLGRAYFGWRGRKATRVLYLGATFLLLAYAGSRFVIEVLLRRAV